MTLFHHLLPILFSGLFIATLPLSANSYHYPDEHAAWGGNGGWWGGGNYDFYDDYPWRTDDDSYSTRCPCRRQYYSACRIYYYVQHPHNGRYCYRNYYVPPVNEYEYNDTVPGAGLYLNVGRYR